MELKKSYKGFVFWMIGFVVAMFSGVILPIEDDALLMRVTLNICVMAIVLLSFIIYKTEYVYWYTGTEYEEAVEAGSERRKLYGLRHFKRFAVFGIIFLVYTVVAQLLSVHMAVDAIVATLGLVGVAISTIGIKL